MPLQTSTRTRGSRKPSRTFRKGEHVEARWGSQYYGAVILRVLEEGERHLKYLVRYDDGFEKVVRSDQIREERATAMVSTRLLLLLGVGFFCTPWFF
jgi:hypothetical protein